MKNRARIYPGQQRVLEAIAAYQRQHGFAPTIREIMHMLGLSSPATVLAHLRALERKGVIVRMPGSSRAIALRTTRTAGGNP